MVAVKERIVGELEELIARTDKLSYFLARTDVTSLCTEQRILLRAQHGVMVAYQQILRTRLELM